MGDTKDIALMAHLMRRAGFGAPYDELEERAAKGYEATVEELLNPEEQPALDIALLTRYFGEWRDLVAEDSNQSYWTFRMINTMRPLEEKIALFWHGIFCVGNSKCEHGRQIQIQLDKFRMYGMGNFHDLLMLLATDPAMTFYLDNCLSHKGSINENWGRELLELFSMGVGKDTEDNYTEEDVKECARAFTGWTITNAIPRYPFGRYESHFVYNGQDHDDEEKTFLGQTGRFNGEDIIDIVCSRPATARFVSRHLYNFFVADEPQVPSWKQTEPLNMDAIKELEDEYYRSNYNIKSMLRLMFNSQWFKDARFKKVKSPAETVAGMIRLVGDHKTPRPDFYQVVNEIKYMGQSLLNPPTVEGWHTGHEWIDSGTLVERVNFNADQVGNTDLPGVRYIIDKVASEGSAISAEQLLDRCLELLGHYELSDEHKSKLVATAERWGELEPGTEEFSRRVGQTLQLLVATQEYIFE